MTTALSLTGRPEDLTAAFERLGGETPLQTKCVSTYFDTPEQRLWHGGYSLKLQKIYRGHELILESANGAGPERRTWASPVEETVPDPALLPADAPLSEIGRIPAADLRPHFRTDVLQSLKRFSRRKTSMEACLARGRIVAGTDQIPVSELALTFLEGDRGEFYRCVRSLLKRHDLRYSVAPRAAEGMRLVAGPPPAVVKATPPGLSAADTVDSAVAKIVAETTAQILGNLAAAADGRDPEGVHQLRVALRRLRSGLALFRKYLGPAAKKLDRRAKAALKELGPARDLDVFLTETLARIRKSGPAVEGLARIEDTARERRAEAYAKVARLIADRGFGLLLADLLLSGEANGLVVRKSDKGLGPVAVALLQNRYGKLRKKGRDFERLGLEKRHEVRIALKKLRYAGDFFQTLYDDKATKPYRKRLAKLQDRFGHLNDAAVAIGLADDLAEGDPLAAAGAASVRAWFEGRHGNVEPALLEAWSGFQRTAPFWEKADAAPDSSGSSAGTAEAAAAEVIPLRAS